MIKKGEHYLSKSPIINILKWLKIDNKTSLWINADLKMTWICGNIIIREDKP